MHREQRRSRRVDVELMASWRRRGRNLDVPVVDMNLHGLLIATTDTIPLNHVMDLRVVLPDGALDVLVASRFVGRIHGVQGIGATIFAATPEDTARWAEVHRRAAQVTPERFARAMTGQMP
jgi:hypothetical protein